MAEKIRRGEQEGPLFTSGNVVTGASCAWVKTRTTLTAFRDLAYAFRMDGDGRLAARADGISANLLPEPANE